MKRLTVPHNATRLAQAVANKAARRAVVTHKVIKPNLGAGALGKFFHPTRKV